MVRCVRCGGCELAAGPRVGGRQRGSCSGCAAEGLRAPAQARAGQQPAARAAVMRSSLRKNKLQPR